jgi:ribosome-binding protein aMBF1 (putative translation factor)
VGDEEDLLATIVDATVARMAASQEASVQLARRRLAIWRLRNEGGMSVAQVTEIIRDALRDRGLSAEELRDAGVSYESVNKIVKGPRPE